MRQHDLGGVVVDKLLDDATWVVPWKFLFPDLSEEQMKEGFAALGPTHLEPGTLGVRLSLHSTIVRTRHHNILVDTCFGNDKERPASAFAHHRNTDYLGNLKRLGLAPEDIDFVCCTHLHGDHIGWNTRLENGRWVPTFPNAKYVFSTPEYRYWSGEHQAGRLEPRRAAAYEDSVLPIIQAGRMQLVDQPGPLTEQVELEFVVGHTPGHLVVNLLGTTAQAVVTGDVIHSPLQFYFPDLSSGACLDPDLSRRNRKALIEKHADTPTILLPAHFVDPTAGRIHRAGARYEYRFVA